MENTKKRIQFTDILLFIVFLLLLAFPAYLCYQVLIANRQTNQQQTDDKSKDNSSPTTETPTEEETPVPTGPKYTEINRVISEQTAYVAVPTNIDENNPPAIILYSHGSNTRVISDLYDPFMVDLQSYGKYFAEKNFIFAASNEHDENWGNAASVQDMVNLEQWIRNNYPTNRSLYLIGFSMGGLPTMHFTAQYPENIVKIALLAPTTRTYEWTQADVDKIKDIDIKIWHGTADVNIGISSSRSFVTYMKKLGKNITLVELDGKTHFDLDTEYMDQVLEFFQAS